MVLNGIGTIFPEDIWKSMGAFLVVIVTVGQGRDTPLVFGDQGPRIIVQNKELPTQNASSIAIERPS